MQEHFLRLPELKTTGEEFHVAVQTAVMLTPSFDIRQNNECVIIDIRAPYIKISEAEFYISGHDFKFYCKPYFLRLHLPGEVTEDGREKATYDVDSGTITVHLPKRNHGEHFENLGMLTTLLSKTPTKDLSKLTSKPLIEVVGGDSGETEGAAACVTKEEEEEEEFDWQMEQQLPTETDERAQLPEAPAYGFANLHKGVFSKLQEEIPSIVDCPDPDHMTPHERRLGRIAHEEASFDPEYYLADLMDNDQIDGLLEFEPPWREELVKWRKHKTKATKTSPPLEHCQDILPFSSAERDQLKELPNKEYLLDKASKRALYLGLVDIIFAYAYNYRTTEGEHDVESAWTICKLSSTLSWLEVFRGSVHEVVYCCLRRTLCYPLHRHWQLALAVLQDTRHLFHLGRRKLLQCLLSVRQVLNSSEPYYILNNLYITDYCVWIQRASSKQIQNLAAELDEVNVDISSIGWDLVELEEAAHLVLEEEREKSASEALGRSSRDTATPPREETVSESERFDTSQAVAIADLTPSVERSSRGGLEHDEHQSSDPSLLITPEMCKFAELGVQSRVSGSLLGGSSGDAVRSLSAGLEKLLTMNPSACTASHSSIVQPGKPLIEEVIVHQSSDNTED